MIHCEPVVDRWTSSWIVGSEIATIVWSMKVIDDGEDHRREDQFRVLGGGAVIGGSFLGLSWIPPGLSVR